RVLRCWVADHAPASAPARTLFAGGSEQPGWAAGGRGKAPRGSVPGAGWNRRGDYGRSGGGVALRPAVLRLPVRYGARVERAGRLGAGSRLFVDGGLDAGFRAGLPFRVPA